MRAFICKGCGKKCKTNSASRMWCEKKECQRARKRGSAKIKPVVSIKDKPAPVNKELAKLQEENELLRKLVRKYKAAYVKIHSAYKFSLEIGEV